MSDTSDKFDPSVNPEETGVIEVTKEETTLLMSLFLQLVEKSPQDDSEGRDLACSVARKLGAAWHKHPVIRRMAEAMTDASRYRDKGAGVVIAFSEDDAKDRLLDVMRQVGKDKPTGHRIPDPSNN